MPAGAVKTKRDEKLWTRAKEIADAARKSGSVKDYWAFVMTKYQELKSGKIHMAKGMWSTSFVNDLPDSAFLFIGPGGQKDASGKTVPRSLRKFPFRGADGQVDLAHLRNAIQRIPQAMDLSATEKATLQKRARKLLPGEQAGEMAKGIGSQILGQWKAGTHPPKAKQAGLFKAAHRTYLDQLAIARAAFYWDRLQKAVRVGPGAGWQPIPGGKHGGYRRQAGGSWEYWYPDQASAAGAAEHHAKQAEVMRKQLGSYLRKKGASQEQVEKYLDAYEHHINLARAHKMQAPEAADGQQKHPEGAPPKPGDVGETDKTLANAQKAYQSLSASERRQVLTAIGGGAQQSTAWADLSDKQKQAIVAQLTGKKPSNEGTKPEEGAQAGQAQGPAATVRHEKIQQEAAKLQAGQAAQGKKPAKTAPKTEQKKPDLPKDVLAASAQVAKEREAGEASKKYQDVNFEAAAKHDVRPSAAKAVGRMGGQSAEKRGELAKFATTLAQSVGMSHNDMLRMLREARKGYKAREGHDPRRLIVAEMAKTHEPQLRAHLDELKKRTKAVEATLRKGHTQVAFYDWLFKGAGHKYIKRVPKPGGGYRYYYQAHHGGGVAKEEHMVAGAAFSLSQGGQKGHYHVMQVRGDQVLVKHDESGHMMTVGRKQLRAMLEKEHGGKLKAHREKLTRDF